MIHTAQNPNLLSQKKKKNPEMSIFNSNFTNKQFESDSETESKASRKIWY